MLTRHLLAAVVVTTLAAVARAPGARAFDLTGTWVEKWSCQGFDGEKFRDANPESTLLVSQRGDALAVRTTGTLAYNGGAIADSGSPDTKGEIALVQCASDDLPLEGGESEVLRAKVKVDPDRGTGRLRGLGVALDYPSIRTCAYRYRRVDTADPDVPPCP